MPLLLPKDIEKLPTFEARIERLRKILLTLHEAFYETKHAFDDRGNPLNAQARPTFWQNFRGFATGNVMQPWDQHPRERTVMLALEQIVRIPDHNPQQSSNLEVVAQFYQQMVAHLRMYGSDWSLDGRDSSPDESYDHCAPYDYANIHAFNSYFLDKVLEKDKVLFKSLLAQAFNMVFYSAPDGQDEVVLYRGDARSFTDIFNVGFDEKVKHHAYKPNYAKHTTHSIGISTTPKWSTASRYTGRNGIYTIVMPCSVFDRTMVAVDIDKTLIARGGSARFEHGEDFNEINFFTPIPPQCIKSFRAAIPPQCIMQSPKAAVQDSFVSEIAATLNSRYVAEDCSVLLVRDENGFLNIRPEHTRYLDQLAKDTVLVAQLLQSNMTLLEYVVAEHTAMAEGRKPIPPGLLTALRPYVPVPSAPSDAVVADAHSVPASTVNVAAAAAAVVSSVSAPIASATVAAVAAAAVSSVPVPTVSVAVAAAVNSIPVSTNVAAATAATPAFSPLIANSLLKPAAAQAAQQSKFSPFTFPYRGRDVTVEPGRQNVLLVFKGWHDTNAFLQEHDLRSESRPADYKFIDKQVRPGSYVVRVAPTVFEQQIKPKILALSSAPGLAS